MLTRDVVIDEWSCDALGRHCICGELECAGFAIAWRALIESDADDRIRIHLVSPVGHRERLAWSVVVEPFGVGDTVADIECALRQVYSRWR